MAVAGVSTVGVLLGYAVETTENEQPISFTALSRINDIGGISLEAEQIDASALEDEITKYIRGRQDTGGTFTITVNLTDATIKEWQSLISVSETARDSGLATWFEVYNPNMETACYVTAEPPLEIPLPETAQNELWTVEMTLTLNDFKGWNTAIVPGE